MRSKIGAIGSDWQRIEDILTGDFFGALDYLPRQPFLRSFFEWVAVLNPDAIQPVLDDVNWDSVEIAFWPLISGVDESAEPDLFIISNRWLIVIEVKLDSGLGNEQPWREYCVGNEIAAERGLAGSTVFFWLVTRQRLNVNKAISSVEDHKRKRLLSKTSHLLWYEVVALVERWISGRGIDELLQPEQHRLLIDVLQVLRRRRAIAFSGFAFTNQSDVYVVNEQLFCPDRFAGFLDRAAVSVNPAIPETHFLTRFEGFKSAAVVNQSTPSRFFVPTPFCGFLTIVPKVKANSRTTTWLDAFTGFLNVCPRCVNTRALDLCD